MYVIGQVPGDLQPAKHMACTNKGIRTVNQKIECVRPECFLFTNKTTVETFSLWSYIFCRLLLTFVVIDSNTILTIFDMPL